MAWERRGKQLYYFRKKREGASVRSLYLGRGPAAVAASLADGVALPEGVAAPEPVIEETQIAPEEWRKYLRPSAPRRYHRRI